MIVIFKRRLKALYALLNQLINAQVDKAGDSVEALYRVSADSAVDKSFLISDCEKKLKAIGLPCDLSEGYSTEALMDTVQTRKKLGMSILRRIKIVEGALEKSKVFPQNLMGLMQTLGELLERDPYYSNACEGTNPVNAKMAVMMEAFFADYRETQMACLWDIDQTLMIEDRGRCFFNDNVMTACREWNLTQGVCLSQYDADALCYIPELRAERGYPTRLELLDCMNSKVGGFDVWGVVSSWDFAYGKKEKKPLGALYADHYQKVDQRIKEGKSAEEFKGELQELDASLLEFADQTKLLPQKRFLCEGRVYGKAANYGWIREHLPERGRVFIFIDDSAEFREMLCQQHQALDFAPHCMMAFDPLLPKSATPKSTQDYRDEFKSKIYELLKFYHQSQQDQFVIAHLLRHQGNYLVQFSDELEEMKIILLDAVTRMAHAKPTELVDLLVLIDAHKVLANPDLRLIYQTVLTRALSVLTDSSQRFELVFPVLVALLKSMQNQCPKQMNGNGAIKKRGSFIEKRNVKSESKFIESMNEFYKAIEPFYAPGQTELGADQCFANLAGLVEVITKLRQFLAVYNMKYQSEKVQHSAYPTICYLSDYFSSLVVEVQYSPNQSPSSNNAQSGTASIH